PVPAGGGRNALGTAALGRGRRLQQLTVRREPLESLLDRQLVDNGVIHLRDQLHLGGGVSVEDALQSLESCLGLSQTWLQIGYLLLELGRQLLVLLLVLHLPLALALGLLGLRIALPLKGLQALGQLFVAVVDLLESLVRNGVGRIGVLRPRGRARSLLLVNYLTVSFLPTCAIGHVDLLTCLTPT